MVVSKTATPVPVIYCDSSTTSLSAWVALSEEVNHSKQTKPQKCSCWVGFVNFNCSRKMDASGRGGPNKYSAQTTFGPVRKRTWGGRRRLMERRDGERVRRYSRGVQRERTTSRQRRRICQQEVLLTGFQSAPPCLPQVPVIWGIPSLKKCLLPSPRSTLRVGRLLLKKSNLSRQQ